MLLLTTTTTTTTTTAAAAAVAVACRRRCARICSEVYLAVGGCAASLLMIRRTCGLCLT